MEEIEHIKKLLDMCKDDYGEYDFVQINITCEDLTAIDRALNRLEQDERVIKAMATYIGKIDVSEDLCDDSICHEGDNCNKCIIDHFRKKCE